jgi:hypothetical protein
MISLRPKKILSRSWRTSRIFVIGLGVREIPPKSATRGVLPSRSMTTFTHLTIRPVSLILREANFPISFLVVHRLFDRRCRTETALAKLARLRTEVGRCKGLGPIFKKLRSSDLEKALTFLDDRLLGSTSNAVERGNRRHRKMQKTVYRVRTQATSRGRIALDMFREAQGPSREQTMKALHQTRRH